jgi:hypothetical protein
MLERKLAEMRVCWLVVRKAVMTVSSLVESLVYLMAAWMVSLLDF